MGFTPSYPLPPGTLFTSCLVEQAKKGPGGRNENWPNTLEKSFKMGFYLLLTSWQPGSTSFTLRRGEKLICGVEWNYSQSNAKLFLLLNRISNCGFDMEGLYILQFQLRDLMYFKKMLGKKKCWGFINPSDPIWISSPAWVNLEPSRSFSSKQEAAVGCCCPVWLMGFRASSSQQAATCSWFYLHTLFSGQSGVKLISHKLIIFPELPSKDEWH